MDDRLVPVPLLDLKLQYNALKADLDAALARVVDSQQFINGPDVAALEEELADYCRVEHCVGVSSGTDALLMSLMALDVGPGDEVVTSSFSFFASAGVIARLGGKPVFVDIEPDSFNMDPDQLEAAITPRTKAIMPVHLFGQCANMSPIMEIARRHNVPVIEDACQAIDAEDNGRKAGSMGLAGCLSFFPSKNLGGFGDGGAILTRDEDFARKLRQMRNHGAVDRYFHEFVGGNFRLDSIQAAVLRVKLKHLDAWTWGRQANAAFYDAALSRIGLHDSLLKLPRISQSRHIFNQYVVQVAERDQLLAYLGQRQIGCAIYYPVPLHLQQCFAQLGYKPGDLPVSEAAAESVLALPIFPELTRQQKQRVVNSIAEYFTSTGRLPWAA